MRKAYNNYTKLFAPLIGALKSFAFLRFLYFVASYCIPSDRLVRAT